MSRKGNYIIVFSLFLLKCTVMNINTNKYFIFKYIVEQILKFHYRWFKPMVVKVGNISRSCMENLEN
jgi:hypothetical protein